MIESTNQEMPDRLFVPCTGPEGSHVCNAEGKPHAYAFGYHQAAKLIANGLEDGHPYWDYVALPLVMLYRHHVELMLKLCIASLSQLLDKDAGQMAGHDLKQLAEFAARLAEETEPDADHTFTQRIVQLCKELNEFDQESIAVRYTTHRKSGDPISLSVDRFDTRTFVKHVEWLVESLDGIYTGAGEMLEAKYEMMAEDFEPEE